MSAKSLTSQKARFNVGDVPEQVLYGFMVSKMAELTGQGVKNKEKISKVASWIKNGVRSSLMLVGGTGTGKTALAKVLVQAIAVRNTWPAFLSMAKLERMCSEDNTWLDEVARTSFLVLDDVGTESREVKLYGNSRMLFNELLFERYDRRLPMIVTTNLSLKDFDLRYGEKVASRVREMFDIMIMNGKDLRI